VAEYLHLIDRMKTRIPNLTLSTDIIVGFPNETEEQFLGTLAVVERVQFDYCYTFIYSPRRGTPAFKMVDNVPLDVKSDRLSRLIKTCDEAAKARAKVLVGKTHPVLVDTVSKKNEAMMSGYTENNKLVHFPGDASLIGKIIPVHIEESNVYTTFGKFVHE
jgi:tRNA-2-methylthio-N6-dimethylallyladenosine synthase